MVFQPGIFIGIIVFLSVKSVGYTDFALLPLVALLVLAITSSPKGPVNQLLNLRPLVWLGKVSYSIYMVHAAVILVLVGILDKALDTPTIVFEKSVGFDHALLNPSAAVGTLFVFILLVVLLLSSYVTYMWIETPFRRKSKELSDRFR